MPYYQSVIAARQSLVCTFENSSVIHHTDTDEVQVADNTDLAMLQALGKSPVAKAAARALIQQHMSVIENSEANSQKIIETLIQQQLIVVTS